MKRSFFTVLLGLLIAGTISSCIGTDVIDDLADEGLPDVTADTTTTDTTENEPPTVATTPRSGMLSGRGGYDAAGTVTLSRADNGDVVLTTSEDFSVTLALGTFLYLSNSESGSQTATSGLEVADVSQNLAGAQTFNVSQIDASVDLSTYRYVVVLCKPARITFGAAELE